ncbi:MATE family efflux transporter [Marinicella sp. W31]|uniref:MATE family efflux transporter n=1 Tax=Marinicella sp. W31 TaxID=3023713 RepID=UPI003756D1E3
MEIFMRIYSVALPILASSLVGLIALFINMGFIGQDNAFNLYIMGILLPISFIVMSLNESLRVSSIAFASQASGDKKFNLFNDRLVTLILVSLAMYVLLNVLFYLIQQPFLSMYKVEPQHQLFIGKFILHNLMVGVLAAVSMLCMSSLYGLGYAHSVSIISILSFAFNVALTYVFVFHLKYGIYSIIYSTLISSTIVLAIALIWLKNIGAISYFKVSSSAVQKAVIKIRNISLPVLAGYGVMFMHVLVFNKLLAMFGPNDIAGFSVSHRLQNIALMPAIATGIAIAIHVNRLRSNNAADLSPSYIKTGVLSSFAIYFLISFVIFTFRESLIGLITSDADVIAAASKYLYYIGPTYFILGPLLVLLIFFEQTGKGVRSLIFNMLSFGLQLGVAFYVAYKYQSLDLVYTIIAAGYLITLFYIFYELRRSRQYYGSNQTQTI